MRFRKYFTWMILVFLVLTLWFATASGIGLAASNNSRIPPTLDYVYGLVRVNGKFVPEGTMISAWCNNEVMVAEEPTIMDNGEAWYALDIPADDPETIEKDGCITGDEVYFKINFQVNGENQVLDAEQIKNWVADGFSRLDLSATYESDGNAVFLPIILR